ncbi:RAMP superfamily CRISPR-associated protein [Accumulibacter sp.]|uniref:RAMP superfamily CRISPR-associated protein n=1 Tax=Accumulibacter sp. TaxID=2053492 RepID=UPI0035B23453
MSAIQIQIVFHSDWHIGEGAGGAGYIDRIVRRHPQDGLPFVPGKTLTGILRDGCERIACGLDDGQTGAWQAFVTTLFGEQSKGTDNPATTTPARLRVGPARLAPELRAALAENGELAAALVFIKPGIAIDPDTGVARSDMLRFEEVVLAGCELTAAAEISVIDGACRQAALALLAAGARAADRLGGKRRRGNGRCEIAITGAPSNLAEILGRAPPDWPSAQACRLVLAAGAQRSRQWQRFALDLQLLAPLVIPERGAGNVIASRDHVPGSLLLPALHTRLRQLLGDRAGQLTSALAGGLVQVRNAYPVRAGERLLPVPAALMAEKERPGIIINELRQRADHATQRKQLRSGYVSAAGLPRSAEDTSPVTTVDSLAVTHAVIEDQPQRPTAAVGGVYTYEAIRSGQNLRAEIWIDRSLLPEGSDHQVLNGEVRIGRAKKDDYGRVHVTAEPLACKPPAPGECRQFTLWLVSPLLARDERLRAIVDVGGLQAWLGKLLGVALQCSQAYVRAHRDDGWNSAWGEPRCTRFGLAAGSCFHFSVTGEPLAAERLYRLEEEGLGERRGEGYGEVRVDPPLLAGSAAALLAAAIAERPAVAPCNVAVTDFSRQIVERAWRRAIRAQALVRAPATAKQLGWADSKPQNSQLGALRSHFEQWSGTPSRQRLGQWLAQLRRTANRIDKWPPATLPALDSVAGEAQAIWSHIDASELPLLPGHHRNDYRQRLADEATRVFWLTVIAAEFDRRARKEEA